MAALRHAETASKITRAKSTKVYNRVSAPAPRARASGMDPFRSLGDAELLRAMFATAGEFAADEVVSRLLTESGGLARLGLIHPGRLQHFGLSERGAHLLLAAAELARRMARENVPDREPMSRPDDVARYLFLRYARLDQEVFGALYLDASHRLIGESEIARGRIDAVAVEPRQTLTEALLRGACSILLFHNHPSGNPGPSAEDFQFTQRFREAAALLGMKLVDHLVLGSPGRFVSVRDRSSW